MWDPTDDKMFERTEPNSGDISYSLGALNNSDLELAVDQYYMFKKHGKWPIDDTVINRIWNQHQKETSCNPFKGRLLVYQLICQEIAERWHLGLLDKSDL